MDKNSSFIISGGSTEDQTLWPTTWTVNPHGGANGNWATVIMRNDIAPTHMRWIKAYDVGGQTL